MPNSGKAQRDREHREATRIAAQEPCLVCGAPAPSMPCHHPRHRGMGSGHAGWSTSEWVPLCFPCHEALDHRSGFNHPFREFVVARIELSIEAWRAKW